jgi:pimeloyl-ACP methyl ester carboxylesterase
MSTLPAFRALLSATALASLAIGGARADVPTDIEAGLKKIGNIVDPLCTARLYRPLMPKDDITSAAQPYPGITVTRNQAFGPDPKDVVDVFAADKGGKARTVLIFVSGGAGDKTGIQDKDSNAFYDNVARWAAKQGMVGVLMQRKPSPAWDGGAKDVGAMLQWVQSHIAEYHGKPDNVFLWAHSAGNGPVSTYLAHPELYTPKGAGVKGVIFMSSGGFDIEPVSVKPMTPEETFGNAGATCSDKSGLASLSMTLGALPGVPPGSPGGPPKQAAGGPPPGAPPTAAEQLAHSNLPQLKKAPFKILIITAELDPRGPREFAPALHDALCEGSSKSCPPYLVLPGHSHMSEVFSADTADTSASGPVLAFVKKYR